MMAGTKLRHGTEDWFDMVGRLLVDAALQAEPSPTDVSLVERYTDGGEFRPGAVRGLRFEIVGGRPAYRVGVGADERADIVVEVSAEASCVLNSLRGGDPAFAAAMERYVASGAFRASGDLSRLGAWFAGVHDRIVAATL